jgi:two-component system sensor histidine kinase AgrC
VEIIDPIVKIHMDPVDLSRMFGILMDNAIEAATLSQEKQLGVALVKTSDGVTIIVENSCPEDMLAIHEMYEEKKSTKGPSRGLGLYHYKTMAQAYENVLIESFVEKNVFKQVLNIKSV